MPKSRVSFSWERLLKLEPICVRQKVAGLLLGNTVLNRSPKARRLTAVGGETIAAPNSCQKSGLSPPPSSTSSAIRKSASPRRLPALPVVIWSLIEGGSVSPAIFHRKLPTLL